MPGERLRLGALRRSLSVVGIFLILSVTLLSCSSSNLLGQMPTPILSTTTDFAGILNSINYSMVEEHVRFLSSLGSRMSGYPGYYIAASYINKSFQDFGLSVWYQKFNVTVPVDYGANLKLVNRTEPSIQIYPMEPNLACPVVANELTGPLVYVGGGKWDEIEGKLMDGAILLMDYESDINWLKVARLGAKAVIFVEPTGPYFPTVDENEQKHLYAFPFNFPRFYIMQDDFLSLYSTMQSVPLQLVYANITSKVVWEQREVMNVVGTIDAAPGSPYKDQIIIFSSHYDSYSVALSVAPGANDALGIATLLEIARLINMPQYKPLYKVMFVAYAGHHQTLEGARLFYRKFLSPINPSSLNVKLQLNIQLSTLSDTLATMNGAQFIFKMNGYVGQLGYEPSLYGELDDYVTKNLIATVNSATGKNYKLTSACIKGNEQFQLRACFPLHIKMDDAEVFALNREPGYIIQTVDNGDYEFSPVDTMDRLNHRNLRNNVGETACIAYGLTQTQGIPTSMFRPIRYTQNVKGVIAEFNATKNWYDPIPNAIVFSWYPGWPRPMVTISEMNGSFAFYEWPPKSPWDMDLWLRVTAFVVDNSTGNILYAPTKGIHEWATGLVGESHMVEWLDMGFLTLFKCGTLVLFDTIHPYDLRGQLGIDVIKLDTEIAPEDFGFHRLQSSYQPIRYAWGTAEPTAYPSLFSVATVYVPPNEPIAILLTSALETMPVAILANTSYERPEGYGYKLSAGQQYVVYNSALRYAVDTHLRSKSYLDILESRNLVTGSILKGRELAEDLMDEAKQAFLNHSYLESYTYQIKAWVQAREPYMESRKFYVDVISLVPYFAVLLLPFVFLVERLIFQTEGRKRLIIMIVTFVIVDSIFSFMHPGFALAFNPILVVVAFFIIILVSPSMYMILNYMGSSLKRLRIKTIGRHAVEISRGSAVTFSFQTGTQNMRKRRTRAILLLVTIILVVIGIVMFSSLESLEVVRMQTRDAYTPYNGVFINEPAEGTGYPVHLGTNIIDFIEGACNGTEIYARAWLYTVLPGDPTSTVLFNLAHEEKEHGVYALIGLSTQYPPEWFETANVAGRWFVPGEVYACILPRGVAKQLDASVGDTVSLLGRNLTVTAIINSEYMDSVVDMDGRRIMPIDYRISAPCPPAQADQTAIVPLDLTLKYDTQIVSLSVIPENTSQITQMGDNVFKTLKRLNVISGVENHIILYGFATSITLFGWQTQIIPIVLAAFMILNIILGSIKERERDIFVYSAVGLSPLHVAFMFLAEMLIYGVVGSMLGYVFTMVVAQWIYGGYGLYLNYSSTFALTAMGIIILVTVLSSLYPVYKASRQITPSLERAWKIPTKPVGSTWDIPLPIIIVDRKDALGLSRYLSEYIKSQEGEVGIFSPEGEISITEGENAVELGVEMRLSPYDQGVKQTLKARFTHDTAKNQWSVSMILERTAGEYELWIRLVRRFATELRRQFLIWRTLPSETKSRYIRD